MIKNSKKPNFSNKIVYKRTLKKRRICKSPALFNGTPRDFQTDKLRNLSFLIRKDLKPKLLQAAHSVYLSKSARTYIYLTFR